MKIPEGHFQASIHGPAEEHVEFEVRDTYLNRWFGQPLWVINVGGGALLELLVATYSENPQPPSRTERAIRSTPRSFRAWPNTRAPA